MSTDRPDQPPPPEGWGQPTQPTQPSWNQAPQQPPPQGWAPQQPPPPQGWAPQQGYPPPGAGYPPPGYGMPAVKGGLNPIGRIASALLIVEGVLHAAFTGYVFLTGRQAGFEPEGFSGPIVADNTIAGLVVVVFFVGVVEVVVGLFAFAGKEWARWFGVGIALIFSVIWLLGVIGGPGLGLGIGSPIVLLFLVANLFIVIALSVAWRFKPR